MDKQVPTVSYVCMYVCMYVCIADSEAPAAAEASSRPKAYASSRDWDKVSSEITQVSLSPTSTTTATITTTATTMILTQINLLYRSWKQRSLKEKRLSTLSSSRYTSNYIYVLHTAHTYIHTYIHC